MTAVGHLADAAMWAGMVKAHSGRMAYDLDAAAVAGCDPDYFVGHAQSAQLSHAQAAIRFFQAFLSAMLGSC